MIVVLLRVIEIAFAMICAPPLTHANLKFFRCFMADNIRIP